MGWQPPRYVSVTRKLAEPLSHEDATEAARGLSNYRVVQIDPALIFAAISLHRKEKISFWDAVIVQAALESGCQLLKSEDLQHGRRFGSLTVDNPIL